MINSTPLTETLFIKDIKWATDETDAVGKDVSNTNDEGLSDFPQSTCITAVEEKQQKVG